MKVNLTGFLIVAAIGFALGGAFALLQSKDQTVQPPAAGSAVAPSTAPSAAITAEPPVLEGVPPMPEVANVAAPEAKPAEAAIAGVTVGGAFTLTDHKGNVVTEKSWPGKFKLVFFGFTHCTDVCPATLQKIAAVMENYDAKGEKLVPLFITVDPEHDTQAVMAAYVGGYNPNIIGLTGTPEQLKAAEDGYKVYAAQGAAAPAGDHMMMDHSSYVYLMSPDDKLLEVFASDKTAEDMIAKIKLHL
ncbi:MAG: SCO family protein [Alphaproteobacteria bacterium]|nr:SCO family protein [Alphaproteobacteria bacterium]